MNKNIIDLKTWTNWLNGFIDKDKKSNAYWNFHVFLILFFIFTNLIHTSFPRYAILCLSGPDSETLSLGSP